MGNNLVIVAIPDENDRVWKVSSEKVPHLTLLFLGATDQVANVDQIVQFVEHAANTTLNRFYLPVDRRDKLGADDADVLFFKKGRYDFKAIRDFRATLLQDNNIKTAYDSAEQFEGPWTPHLTLGYPETPANPMPSDWSEQFYSVEFTKIAVWLGDFDGPEFLLKDFWDEQEALESVPMDVAMSSLSQNDVRVQAGMQALEHYGTKGMKWGVRKQDVASAGKTAGKAVSKTVGSAGKAVGRGAKRAVVAVGDANFEANVDSGHALSLVLKQANHNYTKNDLPALNAKPEFVKARKTTYRLTHPRDKATKQYRREAQNAYTQQLEKTANSMTNSSKTRQYTVRERGDDLPAQGGEIPRLFWTVSSRKIVHAVDSADEVMTVEVLMDGDGFITDIKTMEPDDALAQTAIHGAAFAEGLMHYGVKGMHWGQRSTTPSAVAPKATSRVPAGDRRKTKIQAEGGQNHPAHHDAIKVAEAKVKLAKSGPAALSNQELRDVATRVQLEQQVKQLVTPAGKRFVKSLLGQQGNQAAQQVVGKQIKRKLATAALI